VHSTLSGAVALIVLVEQQSKVIAYGPSKIILGLPDPHHLLFVKHDRARIAILPQNASHGI
jgi:hypothetical protein